MKRASVYRCKKCHALLDCDELVLLTEIGFDQAFALKSKGIAYKPITESTTTKIIIHRCDPENIGICELIGWRKIE